MLYGLTSLAFSIALWHCAGGIKQDGIKNAALSNRSPDQSRLVISLGGKSTNVRWKFEIQMPAWHQEILILTYLLKFEDRTPSKFELLQLYSLMQLPSLPVAASGHCVKSPHRKFLVKKHSNIRSPGLLGRFYLLASLAKSVISMFSIFWLLPNFGFGENCFLIIRTYQDNQ